MSERSWIYAGVFAFFIVRVLPWLVIVACAATWVVGHVRFVP